MMSTVIFIIVLSVLIIVHEWGHFITAKRLGVEVERFSLGFGPKLFSKVHDGTEFMVCLIPLGGYVKMAGDERTTCKGLAGEYFSKSPGHRSLIVVMGPLVNYVLAYLCFVIVFLIGYPTLSSNVGEVLKGYPAQAAGIRADDKIVRIDDKDMESWEDVQGYISSSKADELRFVVLRGTREITLSISPQKEILENVFGQKEAVRIVGIKPAEEIATFRYGLGEALVRSFVKLKDITTMTYKALYRMMTGGMSAKDSMTGPIGIFFIIKKAALMGFSYLLYIVGIISASLAIFNLLPLPVLDGGHLFLLGIEKIRGRALSSRVEEKITGIGFSLIICLALFVFYLDFMRFGLIEKFLDLWR